MEINAVFVHFLLMQVFSILRALIGRSWGMDSGIISFIGLTVQFYALLLTVAAVFAIMSLVRMFQDYLNKIGGN